MSGADTGSADRRPFWKLSASKNVPGVVKPVSGSAAASSTVPMSPQSRSGLSRLQAEVRARPANSPGDAWDDTDDEVIANYEERQRSQSGSQITAPVREATDSPDVVSLVAKHLTVSSTTALPPPSPLPLSIPPVDASPRAQPPSLRSGSVTSRSPDAVASTPEGTAMDSRRLRLARMLDQQVVDLDELRKLCWSGIPDEYRPIAWQLMMGYLPLNKDRRAATLERKRQEYRESVEQDFGPGGEPTLVDASTYHQIHIDVPRTASDLPLFQHPRIQRCIERILYIWAVRHPASGYVQGINDLVTPFLVVFLGRHAALDRCDPAALDAAVLDEVEADSFWCLSKLLDGIQDNYTFAQPGIQRQVLKLKELISRVDAPLHHHLHEQSLEFLQFAFRWMNCLLMREIPLHLTVRMWDTYMAEGTTDGWAVFHVYVCAAFLIRLSKQLQQMEFQELLVFLQNPPSKAWTVKDIELLLSEAYMWESLFQNAQSHLSH